MGFFSALTLIFIVLKVTGVIALSWWWVLTPAAVWLVIYIAIMALVLKFPLWFIDRTSWRK